MLETLRMVDGIIGDLMTGLQNRNLYDSTNLILVSDHGMSSRSCDRVVKLSDYFSTEEIYQMYVYTSASGRISNKYTYSKGNYTVLDTPHISTEEILGKLEGRSSQMAIYRKSQLPKRLHYANNIRIDDIVVKMNDQWVFSRFQAGGSGCSGGTHGWDAQYPSMGGLFVAHGPAFQEGLEVEPFENIEIYSLLTDLLNITGSSNNGTRGSLHHILKNPPVLEREEQTAPSHQAVSISVSQFQAHCNCSLPQEQKRSLLFSPQPSTILQPVTPADLSAVILAYDDHVSAYSPRLHMPAWTSFTVLREDDILQDGESCTVPDSNLPGSEGSLHSRYTNASLGVVSAPLFSTANSECGNITFSSAAVPMQDNLRNDLWVSVWQYVRQAYANTTRPIAVTVGPIFDYNSDGLADSISNISRFVDADSSIPLPSHYFLVLARCRSDVEDFSCGDNLDVLSFILPNDQPINGHSQGRRLHENVARVRDVELLTGLNFFLSADPARNAWLRTRVPLSLWTAAGFISDLTSTSVSYTTTPKPTPPATMEPIPTKPGSWKDQACPGEQSAQCNSSYKPVLLISLDGFRADYLVKYNKTPAIERLTQCGVHAPYMRSVYPTKTFPNHYTIVTGLYPESHGIIDNNMYDFTINRKFSMSSSESNNPDWWGGEPIWRTVQKQGKKSATYFWPGSGVKIQGRYPDIYRPYSDDDPFPKRVNTVLQWLRLPADQRPDFLTLYFNEPDHTGHVVGPDSPQIGEKLAEVDSMIDRLMMGLYYLDMQHCVNIIIIADHGMSGLSCDRQIVLSADISPEDMDNVYVYEGPVGRISTKYRYGRNNNVPINPPVVDTRTLEERLECSSPHMRVYTKNMLPLRHHYTNNDRIDDILLDADDGWTISRKGSSEQYCSGGNHGYDNLYASMHALFVAHGPAFKSGVMVDPFENIELYNLFADLVGVTPAPNNGTVGSLYHLLVAPPNTTSAVPSASPSCSKSTLSTAESVQQNVCQCSTTAVKAGSEWTSLLGDPVPNSEGPALCRTVKWTDHAVGYDKHMKAPAWVAFAVKDVMNVSSAGPETLCVARDPWLANNSLILDSSLLDGTEYQPVNLLLGADEPCNAAMASEVVPMLSEFKNGVWKDLQHLLVDYNSRYGDLSVTVGPVYDYSSTSKWQGLTNNTRLIQNTFPIPTHFFIMIGRCANQTSSLPCWDSLDLLSFLIPHRRSPSNCQNLRQLLRQNVARVRDVEIATGLRFFSDLPIDQAARLRTYLPTQLWEDALVTIPPPKPGHWLNQSCPQPDHADNQCPSDYRPVLLVSLDGFKPQYLNRGFSPVIDRLVACGVHSPAMRSVYPTKTFPNHYTIVTGLYPESHGIVDNTMYDPDIGERFSISSDNKSDPRWWGGEPVSLGLAFVSRLTVIWITAHKQNVTSASFFWVGSDIQIDGSTPDLFKYYAGGVPFSIRVETVVQWMKLPADKRPDLMLLYFDEPDHQAHTSGPFTPEVDAQVQRVDTIMGQLMDSLYQNDLLHCVNLILVSDHGFAPMSCDQVVELRDYFNQTEEDSSLYYYLGPFGRIANTYRRNKDYSFTNFGNNPPCLLGIEPAPNNGTEGSLDHLLWKTFNHSRQPVSQYSINNKPVSSSAPCNCSQASESTLDSAVQVLSSQNITSIKQSALPFGEPLLMTEATGMKLLYQPRHVTAFSDDLKLPLWVSATVDKSMLTNTPVDFNCPVSDPRLSNGSQCRTLLQSIGFDFGDTAVFLSSMIPMKDNFKREVWGSLQDFIVEWAKNYQDLNIISGPAFDTNSDGLADTTAEISRSNASVPTHVFLTVSRCNDTSVPVSRCSKIQTLSFILPQEDSSHKYNCQSVEEYLVDNEARVRDVELITGLQFFPGLPFTQAVAMRTYLPSGLWS
ncbi:hypothetical protein BaRGS_00026518 [Batillaria attramentaria]|uniref:Ectonucleotide pyrophosphatase/phosphodiesterase family member 3 n=1 Tax=Batillaria attramentaria TaxID=370345 RepID=A0ABD0K5R0_9CAEN